jgi:hypothetical protein
VSTDEAALAICREKGENSEECRKAKEAAEKAKAANEKKTGGSG